MVQDFLLQEQLNSRSSVFLVTSPVLAVPVIGKDVSIVVISLSLKP